MDSANQLGFLFGVSAAAMLVGIVGAAFAGLALVKVFAFERSTHSIQFEPARPPPGFEALLAGNMPTDKDMTSKIDQDEDDALDGLDDVHKHSEPLM